VGTAGDVNDDGHDDVIVGALFYDHGQTDEGMAFVYHGTAVGDGLSPSSDWSRDSNEEDAQFGYAVGTAGDVNGDGYLDVIVGASYWDNGENIEGGAWVYHGSVDGLSLTSGWHTELDEFGAQYGYSVATAGDVNGDGYADIVVGAPHWGEGDQVYEGSAWVYYGSADGLPTYSDWHDESNQAWATFGHAVATAGDVNGDGYADVLVGAPGYDNPTDSEGMVFLYYGNGGRGVSLRPCQWIGTEKPLAHLGRAQSGKHVWVGLHRRSPFGQNGTLPESELKPLGQNSDGTDTTRKSAYQPADGFWISISHQLSSCDTNYHWRIRLRYDPVTTPWMPASRWVTVPWNGWNKADFRLPGHRVFVPLVLRNY
jgi:hypothetical protein